MKMLSSKLQHNCKLILVKSNKTISLDKNEYLGKYPRKVNRTGPVSYVILSHERILRKFQI